LPKGRRKAIEGHSVWVSEETAQRLEGLRARNGMESISEVVEEAIAMCVRLRDPADLASYELLTPRLRVVLKMVAEGRPSKAIARRLKISSKTVEFHRARLMHTLKAQGIADLVRFAVRVGAILP
jgi:FixJ family two-component response regulator